MRSVIVHLRKATEQEITKFLSETYPFQEEPPWICLANGDACLYINFNSHNKADLKELATALGYQPAMSVMADVSGRHAGYEEVHSFVSALLKKFDGAVQDDNSEHFWTLDEIDSGHLTGGRRFFDFGTVR